MVCFQTKNPNLGKFWTVLHLKMLVYFVEIWFILRSFSYILKTFGKFCGNLVYFFRFGILYEEKSGNLDCDSRASTLARSRIPELGECFLIIFSLFDQILL
jgi:hypothetical protein